MNFQKKFHLSRDTRIENIMSQTASNIVVFHVGCILSLYRASVSPPDDRIARRRQLSN